MTKELFPKKISRKEKADLHYHHHVKQLGQEEVVNILKMQSNLEKSSVTSLKEYSLFTKNVGFKNY